MIDLKAILALLFLLALVLGVLAVGCLDRLRATSDPATAVPTPSQKGVP